jgi:hypothetical protein
MNKDTKEDIIGLVILGSLFTFLLYQWLDIAEKIYDRSQFGSLNALAMLITFMLVCAFVYAIYEALKEMHENGGILEGMINYVDLTIKEYTYKKEDIMKDPTTALKLAKYSTKFQKSSLSQDDDILNIKVSSFFSMVHELADTSIWPMTPAAQRLEILSMRNAKGEAVAHIIAGNSTFFIYDITHNVNNWYLTEAAKNKDVLSLRKKDGTSVAHQIIEQKSEWINHYKPKHKEVLSIKNNKGEIVGKEIMDASRERPSLLLEFVECGYLCKDLILTTSDLSIIQKKYTIDEVVDFVEIIFEKANKADNSQEKLRILAFAYEIIKNIEHLYVKVDLNLELPNAYRRFESSLDELFEEEPSLLQYAYNGNFDECENAFAIVKRHESALIFTDICNEITPVALEKDEPKGLPY